MSIICGAEEPLKSNPQLLALGDDRGTIETADYDISNLNRYSFLVTDDGNDPIQDLLMVLSRIFLALNIDAYWLTAWDHPKSGINRIRSRALLSKLTTSKWQTIVTDNVGLGGKLIEGNARTVPSEIDVRLASWGVLIAEEMSLSELTQPAILPSFKMFATMHKMLPSRKFLEHIAKKGWGLAYPVNDNVGKSGLVLILPMSLKLLLPRLVQDGVINKILEGHAASQVWE